MMKLLIGIFFTCCAIGFVLSYKILIVCPAVPYSHFTLSFRFAKELADRDHEVTFINSHPQKIPIKNLKDVSVEEIAYDLKVFADDLTNFGQLFYLQQLEWVAQFGRTYSKSVLEHKNIQNLMKSDEKFDLVILHHFFNDALAIFAHKFNCPLILLAPWATNIFHDHIFGNPAPSSFVHHMTAEYGSNMNFWQRLENTYRQVAGEMFIHFRMIPIQNKLLKDIYPESPDLGSILYNASLMLTISHVSIEHPKPLLPNIKEIGGYHVLPPKPLPKEIQDFMDNATEGVVVFSMGSNLKSASFEPDKRRAILNAFSKIKQKVLWKFEADLPERPDNVNILSWLPQSDVLAHPNTVAFISHGGLLSTTEAVYHGVPVLGLPVFWDQVKNIGLGVAKGSALKIDFHKLDEKSFGEALEEILNNPKYRDTAKRYSAILKDQPMKQLDEAVFWTEYVIRHKGAPHLRSAAVQLRWYQLYLLDIILFTILIIVVIFISIYFILKFIFRRIGIVRKNKKD